MDEIDELIEDMLGLIDMRNRQLITDHETIRLMIQKIFKVKEKIAVWKIQQKKQHKS